MTAAITRGNQKTKEVASDLHKFFKSTKPVPRPKNTLIYEFKKQLSEKAATIRSRVQRNIKSLLISLKR